MSTFLKIKLLTIGVLYALNGAAQSLIPDRNLLPEVQVRGALPVETLSPDGPTAARLIAQSRWYNGPAFGKSDSVHYRYSGADRRNPAGGIMYSERITMQTRLNTTIGLRSVPAYNADKSVAAVLVQRWDTGSSTWVNRQRQAYEYKKRRLVRDTTLNWNLETKKWTPAILTHYIRNSEGRPQHIVSLQWNQKTGSLDSVAHIRYQFDAAGNATECLSSYGTGRLQPSTRQEVTYNDAGQATALFEYSWDSVAAVWNPAFGYRFIIGSRGERLMQLNYWGSSGHAFSRYVYNYNTSGRLSHMEYQTATGSNASWQLTERYDYAYDQKGQRISAQRQGFSYGSPGKQIAGQVSDRTVFYYEPLAAGQVSGLPDNGLRIWPVPAQTQLHLDIRSVSGQPYRATITDLQGRSLRSWNRAAGTSSTDKLDLDGIPSGTYNLIVQTGAGKSFIARFVVAG